MSSTLPAGDGSRVLHVAAADLVSLSNDEFVDTAEASKITLFARSTLESMRVRGGGPTFYKIGRRVAYRRGDLLAFLRSGGPRKSTSDKGAAK